MNQKYERQHLFWVILSSAEFLKNHEVQHRPILPCLTYNINSSVGGPRRVSLGQYVNDYSRLRKKPSEIWFCFFKARKRTDTGTTCRKAGYFKMRRPKSATGKFFSKVQDFPSLKSRRNRREFKIPGIRQSGKKLCCSSHLHVDGSDLEEGYVGGPISTILSLCSESVLSGPVF